MNNLLDKSFAIITDENQLSSKIYRHLAFGIISEDIFQKFFSGSGNGYVDRKLFSFSTNKISLNGISSDIFCIL